MKLGFADRWCRLYVSEHVLRVLWLCHDRQHGFQFSASNITAGELAACEALGFGAELGYPQCKAIIKDQGDFLQCYHLQLIGFSGRC